MTFSHLIFDLDGTLIDSSDGVVEATNYAFRQVGLPECPPDQIKPYIGYPLGAMFADLANGPVDELCRHFQVKAATSVVGSARVLDDVAPALQEFRAHGYRMAIATTKIRVHVDSIIEKFHWQEIFDTTVAGNEVARVKPSPDALLLAMDRMKAIPQSTLMIGDTENDILAAQSVPTRVAAVTSPYGGAHKVLALRPDYVVSSLLDLVTLLITATDLGLAQQK